MQTHGFDFDVAILGGGSGGFAAARTAVAHGLTTALIDGADRLGGLCILRGCMPTKALLYAAEVLHVAQHPQVWGVRPGEVGFDFPAVMARKNAVIQEFADFRVRQLENSAFRLIRATARFADPHTLILSTGQRLTAAHFVIATGSTLAPSPLPQLAELQCLNSDSALELQSVPKSLIVLGGGAVALEFAQFFARFGSQVTVVQRSNRVLQGFDADVAAELEQALEAEEIQVITGTKLIDAAVSDGRKTITFQKGGQAQCLHAAEVFFGLGRIPNLSNLQLDKAGVQTEGHRIATNDRMQTSASHIYAAGDCTGLHEIVHIAIQQGETAAVNIAQPHTPRTMDYRLLTEVVFTDPQVACVGLTEKRAQAAGMAFISAQYPFNDHGKSIIMNVRHGFVKLLADPRSGEILGGACVGPHGGELIHEIVAAMCKRMTVAELAAMPHYHPTLAEIWTYPAEELAESVNSLTAMPRLGNIPAL